MNNYYPRKTDVTNFLNFKLQAFLTESNFKKKLTFENCVLFEMSQIFNYPFINKESTKLPLLKNSPESPFLQYFLGRI